MSRIIISSSRLITKLQEILNEFTSEDITVNCKDKQLFFNGENEYEYCLDVEAKSEFCCCIAKYSLQALLRILKAVGDQPIILTFRKGHIEINSLLV